MSRVGEQSSSGGLIVAEKISSGFVLDKVGDCKDPLRLRRKVGHENMDFSLTLVIRSERRVLLRNEGENSTASSSIWRNKKFKKEETEMKKEAKMQKSKRAETRKR